MANDRTSSPAGPVGVIDLGSNTVLLLVLGPDGAPLLERSIITRLGEGVFERGRLSEAARERSRAAATELVREAREAGCQRIVVVATEALRRAEDGAAFLDGLGRSLSLDQARILSGEEEARATIEASRSRGDPVCVIDVGGGSTEIAWSRAGRVRGISLALGSVRLTEACVSGHPVARSELLALRSHARAVLARAAAELPPGPWPSGRVVAVAGTATTLAALDQRLERYDPDRVEGYVMTAERLDAWVERLAALTLEARRGLPGLEPGRADVIVAGARILREVLASLGAPDFTASGRGVRYGIALALLAGREAV